MQTFLPYADFAASARALDDKRLGKQRVEVLQILRALHRPDYGWRNHPAVLMWRGYEAALGCYGVTICQEWCRRGHADTCETKIRDELREIGAPVVNCNRLARKALPPWLGDERVHASHRASLLRKDPDWYGERFTDDPELPYFWPARETAT